MITQSDLDSFHQFATNALSAGACDLSLQALLDQWHKRHDAEDTIASIKRGVADAEAGRAKRLVEVDAKIRNELGFPARGR
jgi:hypothetical protein